MPIGPRVRSVLGRLERPAVDLYRSLFVNLDELVRGIRACSVSPRRVLEIGCGAGIVTEHLAAAFPVANITGIDICERPGSLCATRNGQPRFMRMTVAELRATRPEPYDLIVISDVLHHVPQSERRALLANAARLVAPRGMVVLKEWVRQMTPAYMLGYCSDRFITGDRIQFTKEEELRQMAAEAFGADSVRSDFRVPPWSCNLALVIVPRSTEQ
jgi:2-polyprenyl-3-methyl-5-hydroxy-6-metoxy-1,4-benzoquinol methylase